MADKRISEIQELVTANDLPDTNFLATDNPTENTAKITVLEKGKKDSSLVQHFQLATLTKTTTNDFEIATNGITPVLRDGVKIRVRSTGLAYDFQNKLNPLLNVDATGNKPIYSSYHFYNNGSTDLDRNSIGNGVNVFEYVLSLDAWLWSNESYPSNSIHYFTNNTTRAGFLFLGGATVQLTDCPNYAPYFADTTTLADMTNASFAGVGNETPYKAFKSGQMQTFGGEFGFQDNVDSGIFYRASSSRTNGIFQLGSSVTGRIADVLNADERTIPDRVVINLDGQVVNGSQTLTARWGCYMHLKL